MSREHKDPHKDLNQEILPFRTSEALQNLSARAARHGINSGQGTVFDLPILPEHAQNGQLSREVPFRSSGLPRGTRFPRYADIGVLVLHFMRRGAWYNPRHIPSVEKIIQ